MCHFYTELQLLSFVCFHFFFFLSFISLVLLIANVFLHCKITSQILFFLLLHICVLGNDESLDINLLKTGTVSLLCCYPVLGPAPCDVCGSERWAFWLVNFFAVTRESCCYSQPASNSAGADRTRINSASRAT